MPSTVAGNKAAQVRNLLHKKVRFGQMAAQKRKEALNALAKSARARALSRSASTVQKYRNEHAQLKALANRYSKAGTAIATQLNSLVRR